jgi:hypothetical protein
MSDADNSLPSAGPNSAPIPPPANSKPRRVSWLSAFIIVAVLGSFRVLVFSDFFGRLTRRDTTPYVLIGLAFVFAAIILTRAAARGPRS